jgi:hypothetical protein
MKKIYAAPTLVESGEVLDTRGSAPPGPESIGRLEVGAGRVGFYL